MGDRLQYEQFGNNELWFLYDADGLPAGVRYDDGTAVTYYYYVCNWRGDVVALYSDTGLVCKYDYDAWGNITAVKDANGTSITSSTHIANINPIRYRGYYYDSETNLYYLASRYYDPTTRRFINADSIIVLDKNVLNNNTFAYCLNNPIIHDDSTGFYSGIDDLVAIGAGTLAGIVGQALSDLLNWELSSSEDYWGAAAGGALGGWVFIYYPTVSAAVSGGASTFISGYLKMINGKSDIQIDELLFESVASAGLSALIDQITFKGVKIGYGKYEAKYSSNMAKLAVAKPSLKTFKKATQSFIYGTLHQIGAGIPDSTIRAFSNSCNNIICSAFLMVSFLGVKRK